jgi:hypothetical protein
MGHPGIIPQLGSASVRPSAEDLVDRPVGKVLVQATGRMDVGMSPHIIPRSRVRTNLLFIYLLYLAMA